MVSCSNVRLKWNDHKSPAQESYVERAKQNPVKSENKKKILGWTLWNFYVCVMRPKKKGMKKIDDEQRTSECWRNAEGSYTYCVIE